LLCERSGLSGQVVDALGSTNREVPLTVDRRPPLLQPAMRAFEWVTPAAVDTRAGLGSKSEMPRLIPLVILLFSLTASCGNDAGGRTFTMTGHAFNFGPGGGFARSG
jgi:hypothetical protein